MTDQCFKKLRCWKLCIDAEIKEALPYYAFSGHGVLSLVTFRCLWKTLLPFIAKLMNSALVIHAPETSQCIIPLIMHSRYIIPLTHFSLVPCIFWPPRKCGLYGINCEAIPRQVNYLIDECGCITKGANVVVSYLDHLFRKSRTLFATITLVAIAVSKDNSLNETDVSVI